MVSLLTQNLEVQGSNPYLPSLFICIYLYLINYKIVNSAVFIESLWHLIDVMHAGHIIVKWFLMIFLSYAANINGSTHIKELAHKWLCSWIWCERIHRSLSSDSVTKASSASWTQWCQLQWHYEWCSCTSMTSGSWFPIFLANDLLLAGF